MWGYRCGHPESGEPFMSEISAIEIGHADALVQLGQCPRCLGTGLEDGTGEACGSDPEEEWDFRCVYCNGDGCGGSCSWCGGRGHSQRGDRGTQVIADIFRMDFCRRDHE